MIFNAQAHLQTTKFLLVSSWLLSPNSYQMEDLNPFTIILSKGKSGDHQV